MKHDDIEHGDHCLRARLMGTIHGMAPGSYLQVHHVTCEHGPADLGGIGLQMIWHKETESDELAYQATTIVLAIGDALALCNRLTAAVSAAMAVGEEPIPSATTTTVEFDLGDLRGYPDPMRGLPIIDWKTTEPTDAERN